MFSRLWSCYNEAQEDSNKTNIIQLNEVFANHSKDDEIYPLTVTEIVDAQKADTKRLGCQLLSNYSVFPDVTVFLTANYWLLPFFQYSYLENLREKLKSNIEVINCHTSLHTCRLPISSHFYQILRTMHFFYLSPPPLDIDFSVIIRWRQQHGKGSGGAATAAATPWWQQQRGSRAVAVGSTAAGWRG